MMPNRKDLDAKLAKISDKLIDTASNLDHFVLALALNEAFLQDIMVRTVTSMEECAFAINDLIGSDHGSNK